ncbi:uncharacterized protein LOC117178698 [Belonocnema kinseyi]|uniref:uncharacterized protein LOC117178698 n=1 Tax=Belonocnema kinseyi TaxID=2817044 RepID=UPI00143D4317|nr:uncharacterized protein LOC117178698 [Belonocnema kinseyi]
MGLIVDVPKHRSGTSNTGNTARRFFRYPDLTSEIRHVVRELIRTFGIILQAMASGEAIDTFKFGKYCQQTAQMYFNLYNWYGYYTDSHHVLKDFTQYYKCSYACLVDGGGLLKSICFLKNQYFIEVAWTHFALQFLISRGGTKLREFLGSSLRAKMTDKLVTQFTWKGDANQPEFGDTRVTLRWNVLFFLAQQI